MRALAQQVSTPWTLGRYAIFGEIAAGGMATLHLGRLLGDAGFARTVAIKRLRTSMAGDRQFLAMFLDEARVAARIRHPNVAATIDVVCRDGEVLLVIEYVHGESLGRLVRAERSIGAQVDPKIVASVICGALHGLHAAHEAKNERGEALHIVHRDVSPQNVLVGDDGLARVVDFGIAKAKGRLGHTQTGELKGKLAYMAPEQLQNRPGIQPDRRTDVFSAGIVLWESLTGESLFYDPSGGDVAVLNRVQTLVVRPPGRIVPDIPPMLDGVVLRALERKPEKRFPTAREFALALEDAMPSGIATQRTVGEWVERLVGWKLAERSAYLLEIESSLPSDVEAQGPVSLEQFPGVGGEHHEQAQDRRSSPTSVDEPVTFSTVKQFGTPQVEADPPEPPAASEDGQEKTVEIPRARIAEQLRKRARAQVDESREWSTMRLQRKDLEDPEADPGPGAPRRPTSRSESAVIYQGRRRRGRTLQLVMLGAICFLLLLVWAVSTWR